MLGDETCFRGEPQQARNRHQAKKKDWQKHNPCAVAAVRRRTRYEKQYKANYEQKGQESSRRALLATVHCQISIRVLSMDSAQSPHKLFPATLRQKWPKQPQRSNHSRIALDCGVRIVREWSMTHLCAETAPQ